MFKIFKKIKWFFSYYKKEYTVAILLMLTSYGLFLVPPKIIGEVSDLISKRTLTKEVLFSKVILLLVVTIVIYLSNLIWQYFIFRSNDEIGRIVRSNLAKKILWESPRFFEINSTGSLMGKITTDVSNLAEMSGSGVLSFFESFVALSIYLVAMLMIDPLLCLVSFIPLPLIAVFTKYVSARLYSLFDKVEKVNDKINELVLENVLGVRVIRAYSKEENEIKRFEERSKNLYDKMMDESKTSALWGPIGRGVSGASYVIAFLFGAHQISKGALTIGQLITFIMYLGNIVGPMFSLGDFITMSNQASASSDRISNVLNEKIDLPDGEKELNSLWDKTIEFRNFSFKYPSSKSDLLKEINLTIEPGQTLGVVGKVGSGKTTFLKQILKFYKQNEGELFIGSSDIVDIKSSTIRDKIGYVPQNHLVFSKSLEDNVLFSKKKDSKGGLSLEEALSLADLEKDLSQLPNGIETMIGEKGVSLSGGQKQRLQIARALIIDPELLILDDSLSAVDAKTEEKILKNLRETRKGKMTFISSHRLSAVINADTIIVLKDGRIDEIGNHESLMKNKGWYYEQFLKQQKEA
ncbi:ABC transporter ATP-binding protein [Citroniella saccharovorans]